LIGELPPTVCGTGEPTGTPAGRTRVASVYGVSEYTFRVKSFRVVRSGTGRIDATPSSRVSIPPVNGVLHVVTDKETLSDISKRTGISVSRIVQANGLKQPTVFVGQWILVPGAKPNPTHYHTKNDVCWYILYGKIRVWAAKSDGSDGKEIILEGGDFVYIPSGAIHVISNASETDEASLVFCYIGVGNTDAAETVWLPDMKLAG